MKNVFLLLIITFTLLIVSNVESKSTCSCPTNYTPQTFTVTLPSGCVVDINYCLFCQPTGHPILELCSVTLYTGSCTNINVDFNFWNLIRTEMIKHGVTNCGNVGPCPERVTMDIYQATCLKLVNDWDNGMVHIVSCDLEPGKCIQEYEVCYVGLQLQITKIGNAVVIEEGECDTEEVIILPPPYNLFQGCFSSCY